ncbi:MAG: hypothetical protein ACLUE2_16500 [Bacteroides cellulosilyticus]
MKCLRPLPVLGVDERAVFEIVEAEAVFQFVAFGQHDAFFQ